MCASLCTALLLDSLTPDVDNDPPPPPMFLLAKYIQRKYYVGGQECKQKCSKFVIVLIRHSPLTLVLPGRSLVPAQHS